MSDMTHGIGELKVNVLSESFDLTKSDDMVRMIGKLLTTKIDYSSQEQAERAFHIYNTLPLLMKADFLTIPGVAKGFVNIGKDKQLISDISDMYNLSSLHQGNCFSSDSNPHGKTAQLKVVTTPGVVAALMEKNVKIDKGYHNPGSMPEIVGELNADDLTKVLSLPDARESLKKDASSVLYALGGINHEYFRNVKKHPELMKFFVESGCAEKIIHDAPREGEFVPYGDEKVPAFVQSMGYLIDAGYSENIMMLLEKVEYPACQARALVSGLSKRLVEKGFASRVALMIESFGTKNVSTDEKGSDGKYGRMFLLTHTLSSPGLAKDLVDSGSIKVNKISEAIKMLPSEEQKKISAAVGEETFEAFMGPVRNGPKPQGLLKGLFH